MINLKKILTYGIIVLITFVPFNTIITVWFASNFNHLYIWTSWIELLTALLSGVGLALFIQDNKLRGYILSKFYNKISILFLILCSTYLIIQHFSVNALVGYSLDTRFIFIFLVAQVSAYYLPSHNKILKRILITVATIVSVIAILQIFVLPATFLTHFGYDSVGTNTPGIPPAVQYASSGSDLVRAQSTLRGPNMLGAYLVLPIFMTAYYYLKLRKKWLVYVALIMLLALIFSYSRSAVIGLGIGAVLWFVSQPKTKDIIKHNYRPVTIGLLILFTSILFAWKSSSFQTVILHNNPKITATQSNEGHLLLTKHAIKQVIHSLLGLGLGSAGPSSALKNPSQARIAEDNYIQIGQEIGWLGMILFIGVTLSVIRELWRYKDKENVMPILLAMIGVSVINLMLHVWTDEAVSMTLYVFIGTELVLIHQKRLMRSKPS